MLLMNCILKPLQLIKIESFKVHHHFFSVLIFTKIINTLSKQYNFMDVIIFRPIDF